MLRGHDSGRYIAAVAIPVQPPSYLGNMGTTELLASFPPNGTSFPASTMVSGHPQRT